MSQPVVTVIDAVVPPDREQALLEGFQQLSSGAQPEGLVRSELLRGQGGAWRIQTTWRDLVALRTLRAIGEPPAALALLDDLGVEHAHGVFTIEQVHAP